jgi:hypothetical protein
MVKVKENKLSVRTLRASAKNHVYVSARLGGSERRARVPRKIPAERKREHALFFFCLCDGSIWRASDSPALSFSAMRRENSQPFIKAMISICYIWAELTLMKLRVTSYLVFKSNNTSFSIEKSRGISQR